MIYDLLATSEVYKIVWLLRVREGGKDFYVLRPHHGRVQFRNVFFFINMAQAVILPKRTISALILSSLEMNRIKVVGHMRRGRARRLI